jgi:hypothetical protein
MGPKVDAIGRVVEAGGSLGAIGRMEDAAGLLSGETGTVVRARSPRAVAHRKGADPFWSLDLAAEAASTRRSS